MLSSLRRSKRKDKHLKRTESVATTKSSTDEISSEDGSGKSTCIDLPVEKESLKESKTLKKNGKGKKTKKMAFAKKNKQEKALTNKIILSASVNENKDIGERNHKSNEDYDTLLKKVGDLESKVKHYCTENQSITEEKERLTSLLEQKEIEGTNLKNLNTFLMQQAEEIEEINFHAHDSGKFVSQKEEIENIKSSLKNKVAECEKLRIFYEYAVEQVHESESKISELKMSRDTKKFYLENLNKLTTLQKNDAESKLTEYAQEKDILASSLAKTMLEKDNLEKSMESLAMEIENMRALLREKDATYTDLRLKYDCTFDELQGTLPRISDLSRSKDKQKKYLDGLHKLATFQRDDFEGQLLETKKERDNLQSQLSVKTTETSLLVESNGVLKEELNEAKLLMKEKDVAYCDLRSRYEYAAHQIHETISQLSDLKRSKDSQKTYLEGLNKLTNLQKYEAETQLSEALKEKKYFKACLEAQSTEKTNLSNLNTFLMGQLDDMELSLEKKSAECSSVKALYGDTLDKCNKELERKKSRNSVISSQCSIASSVHGHCSITSSVHDQ